MGVPQPQQIQHQQVYQMNPSSMPYTTQFGSVGTPYGYRPVNSAPFAQPHGMNSQQPPQMYQRQY